MSELPKGWVECDLQDISELITKGTTPTTLGFKFLESGIRFIKIENIKNKRIVTNSITDFISSEAHESLRRSQLKLNDILFSIAGTIGEACLVKKEDIPANTNQAVAIIRGTTFYCIPQFLLYQLSSLTIKLLKEKARGGAMNNISLGDLRTAKIILSPLNEQRRIVAKLDSLFARSRRAREELERVPKLCDRYKQAVLAAAFRGDLTADWREENISEPLLEDRALIDGRLTDLLNLPNEWVWTNVSHVASVTGGLTKNQSRISFEKKAPYLRVANVYANELRLDDIAEIGIADSEWERVKLKAGDLLIVEGNGSLEQIGRVALWHGEIEPCVHQNHLIKLRVKNIISPKFALYWLLSPSGRRAIEQVASSSAGLHTLSISKVSALPIPLCAVQEMEVVVERIEKLFKAIDLMEQEYQKASKLCDRLDQATLSKAFRGELVPQDPNDEPAAALLERILAENSAQTKGKSVKSKQRSGGQS